ncbi:MAG: NAD-dependent epimerase/dehydratase family protein [Chakrabartia sp.]
MSLRIVIAGASGLVGRALVDQLCALPSVTALVALARRPLAVEHAKLTQKLGPQDHWPGFVEEAGADAAISTLGTTLRDAGSQDAFFAVDHDLVLSFARAACGAGARQFLMVSSVGAHAASRNFYLATKGKVEADVANIGFERLDVLRPGLLRGRRTGPLRMGERLAIAVAPVTDFLTPAVLSRYRSIRADQVAAALAQLVGAPEPGQFVHHNDEMVALASQSARRC